MKEDKRLKRKVRRSYIVSTISISLVLFLLGSVGYLLGTALGTAHTLRRSITLSVELNNSLDDEQKSRLEADIKALEGVSQVTYSDRSEKLDDVEFRRMFAAEIEEILEDNPLRNSFEVAIVSGDRAVMDALVDKLSAMEGVVYVAYPAATIERLHSAITKITIVLIAFGGALLIISLILLNNTIRLAIYSRRYLINTFKMVGATKWYIMRPLLGTAAKQGLWAGIMASLLFGGAVFALSGAMPEIMSVSELTKIGIIVGGMITIGLIISLLFTTFAVNKFVNMNSNKIHLY
ncbi:MAG: permease-like cell division protein FtsX [Alistipes sp.]|jgi:cell division transport system permease protein|nr:permease-like cell division protein FtsX [Alistipes sp.]